uniref:Uncharacterized protein n=1 Tax=Myotis myotis TaxID=51298 RepID=A0A7J7TIN0_MYOMY|nr:hypothetical protein mMyoMyo1_009032 [Myotis myotis]
MSAAACTGCSHFPGSAGPFEAFWGQGKPQMSPGINSLGSADTEKLVNASTRAASTVISDVRNAHGGQTDAHIGQREIPWHRLRPSPDPCPAGKGGLAPGSPSWQGQGPWAAGAQASPRKALAVAL